MTVPPDHEIAARLDFAVKIAHEAGDVTLRYFRRDDLAVERKADKSPVTIADREAEKLLRERIAERFPDDGIVGEEFGTQAARPATNGCSIRSTARSRSSTACRCTQRSLRCCATTSRVVGVIHAPAVAETVYAAKGGGCWHTARAESTAAAGARFERSEA